MENNETVFPLFPPTSQIDQTDFHVPIAAIATRWINLSKLASYWVRILRARSFSWSQMVVPARNDLAPGKRPSYSALRR